MMVLILIIMMMIMMAIILMVMIMIVIMILIMIMINNNSALRGRVRWKPSFVVLVAWMQFKPVWETQIMHIHSWQCNAMQTAGASCACGWTWMCSCNVNLWLKRKMRLYTVGCATRYEKPFTRNHHQKMREMSIVEHQGIHLVSMACFSDQSSKTKYNTTRFVDPENIAVV